ncbi:MAG TPA: hypothetical protein VHY20_15205 [Pirellulales bacterium]|nr:hypothetical protein [Pirellulales bacterium]
MVIFVCLVLIGMCNEAMKSPEQRAAEEKQRIAQEVRDAAQARVDARTAAATKAQQAKADAALAAKQEAERAEREKYGTDGSALVAARDAVLRQLQFPSSAKFPWFSSGTAHLGGDTWVVKGTVDAQNAFGAKIRHHWTVSLKHISGREYDVVNVIVTPEG